MALLRHTTFSARIQARRARGKLTLLVEAEQAVAKLLVRARLRHSKRHPLLRNSLQKAESTSILVEPVALH